MKVIGYLLGACILLAIVKAVAAALIVTLVLAIVIGIITKPRETFGLLAFLLISSLLQTHTLAVIGGVTALLVLGAIIKRGSGEG